MCSRHQQARLLFRLRGRVRANRISNVLERVCDNGPLAGELARSNARLGSLRADREISTFAMDSHRLGVVWLRVFSVSGGRVPSP